jgi:cellulose synthase/poly-beta-1,6-N-acetylglucosamine synthase-like glycosyltransferase
MYNEPGVAGRVIRAAASLNWPRDRLQVQVLDDSDDDCTPALAQRACHEAASCGVNIEYGARPNRDGYKAGALAHGLQSASGEFIAVFDADFVPGPEFLRSVFASRAFDDPATAFVQARWDFINRHDAAHLRAQGLMLDMHFVVEQPARSATGLLFNFNGSGGVWRRTCIEQVGWQGDTLAEDLDLSYRARLAGWKARYLQDVVIPCELTSTFSEFKRQQARWARGSAQCFRKLAPGVLRSALPWSHRVAGLLHVSGYLLHALLCVLAVTTGILGLRGVHLPLAFSVLGLCGVLPLITMCVAHRARAGSWVDLLRALPSAALFGIGLSVSNAAGWISGFFSRHVGRWEPTPKGGLAPAAKLRTGAVELTEAVLAVFTTYAATTLTASGSLLAAANTMIFASGFVAALVLGGRTLTRQR